jgi:exopolysaccharide production protein ExoQ
MPRDVATVIYGLFILSLFLLDRDRKAGASPVLWIPIAWVSIGASRMISQWFGVAPVMESPDEYLDGSPIDRLILAGLVAGGCIVLVARGQRLGAFLRANGPILAFFIYGAISVLWSDYPEVSFKRWTKAVGDVVMVLVVLTDRDPSAAVRGLLARSGFLLVPASVLLIKYYPELGRYYDRWTWLPYYSGVGMGKNSLGIVCLIFGLASLWRFLDALSNRRHARVIGPLIAHGAILAMAWWLLRQADSSTSLVCFLVGGGLMVLTMRFSMKPAAVHTVVASIAVFTLCGLFLDLDAGLVEAVGRDATLTGRTQLWREVLRISGNPLFGSGFDSFWLGERAKFLWETLWWHPNQAHNGYLEVFLNLGWLGVALLSGIIVWAYPGVVASTLQQDLEMGRLRLAFFVVTLLYNLTEAAFKELHPVWIVFLLAVIAVPKVSRRVARQARMSGVSRAEGPVTA